MSIASSNDATLRSYGETPLLERRGISWGAVLAGVVTALASQLVLSIAGLGLGLASIDPATTGAPSASHLSMSAGLWWAGSGIIAAAAGGYVAGRLSGKLGRGTAGYHGLVTWAATTLVIVFLLSSAAGSLFAGTFGAATSVLGGAGRLIGGAAQTGAQTAAPALQQLGDPLSAIEGQIKTATNGQDPAQLRDTAASAVKAALTGDPAEQQQAMDRAADALAKARNIPVDQAKQQVVAYQEQYAKTVSEAKAKAVQIADQAAKATSQAALSIALSLVLGALAGFIGGRLGATADPRT